MGEGVLFQQIQQLLLQFSFAHFSAGLEDDFLHPAHIGALKQLPAKPVVPFQLLYHQRKHPVILQHIFRAVSGANSPVSTSRSMVSISFSSSGLQ